jgi:predicted O-methyltransferase YrrM
MRIGPGQLLDPELRQRIAATVDSIELDAGGGASLLKLYLLADLVVAESIKRVVEIGVYHGRLLLSLALVFKHGGSGEIVGIDPYTAAAAVQNDGHGAGIDLRTWPDTVEWDALYKDVRERISMLGLDGNCRIVRARSADVATRFPGGSIDLLHIDGNHDRTAVEQDLALYLPRVTRPGGYVVLDDASWLSIRPVFDELRNQHELVFQLFDIRGLGIDRIGGNDFAVFRLSQ